ncbi:MAG: dihydrolipoamide acyltransferase, partial [Porcipelethomonas sp.]
MKEIKTGMNSTAETTVTAEKLASAVGSGSLDVFATPMMTALMEKAAAAAVAEA